LFEEIIMFYSGNQSKHSMDKI